MSNPALRRDIERRLRYAVKYSDAPFEKTCRLALFALDMRDGLERLLEGEIPITIRAADIREVIEKFDGASDEQKHNSAGEWGGGHTR